MQLLSLEGFCVTTLDDFRGACGAYRRQMLTVFGITLLTLVVAIAVGIAFKSEIRGFFTHQFNAAVGDALMGTMPVPAVIVLLLGSSLIQRRARRTAALRCPHCGKQLEGIQTVVIATRNCGFCGKQVIEWPS